MKRMRNLKSIVLLTSFSSLLAVGCSQSTLPSATVQQSQNVPHNENDTPQAIGTKSDNSITTNQIDSTNNPTPSKNDLNKNDLNKMGAKGDYFYVYDTLEVYNRLFESAINKNNFSIVSDFLIPGTPVYEAQKQLISELGQKGVKAKQDFNGHIDIKSNDQKKFNMYVKGTFTLTYQDGKKQTTNFNRIYTIQMDVNQNKIADIQDMDK